MPGDDRAATWAIAELAWPSITAAGSEIGEVVDHWRSGIIASISNLARHSRSPEGDAIPQYLANSNLRFQQWILDTCFRPYDQDWINYQQEIALRHTSLKKNKVESVRSTRTLAGRYCLCCGDERDLKTVSSGKG